jgi:hypothetical protein
MLGVLPCRFKLELKEEPMVVKERDFVVVG